MEYAKLLDDLEQTKTFEIEGMKFKIRKLSWYEDTKLKSECMEIDPKAKKVNLNEAQYQLNLIKTSLIESPIPKERFEELLPTLKPKVARALIKEIQDFGEVDGEYLKK